jgi:hypothetical protein
LKDPVTTQQNEQLQVNQKSGGHERQNHSPQRFPIPEVAKRQSRKAHGKDEEMQQNLEKTIHDEGPPFGKIVKTPFVRGTLSEKAKIAVRRPLHDRLTPLHADSGVETPGKSGIAAAGKVDTHFANAQAIVYFGVAAALDVKSKLVEAGMVHGNFQGILARPYLPAHPSKIFQGVAVLFRRPLPSGIFGQTLNGFTRQREGP